MLVCLEEQKGLAFTPQQYRVAERHTGNVRTFLYRVGQKSKPDNFCNNFVYCQLIFIIFGKYTL